ncbi:MAG: cupin domain-containing protein [Opitutaceae bacterium]
MNAEAANLISKMGLVPLPREGGFFSVAWTSPRSMPDGRASGSAILFLITEADFSALHRLRTDELWHYHAGDPAAVVQIDPGSHALETSVLGPDVAGTHLPTALVPAGSWQGARLHAPGAPGSRGWTLFSCTLSPAWDEREFELGERGPLLREFPEHARLILDLTR